MKTKTFNEDLWNTCVEQYGFLRGYAVIGLKMVLVALGDRKLAGWNLRRIESNKKKVIIITCGTRNDCG